METGFRHTTFLWRMSWKKINGAQVCHRSSESDSLGFKFSTGSVLLFDLFLAKEEDEMNARLSPLNLPNHQQATGNV